MGALDVYVCMGSGIAMSALTLLTLRRVMYALRRVLQRRRKLSWTHHGSQLFSDAKQKVLSWFGRSDDLAAARTRKLITDHQVKAFNAYSLEVAFLVSVPVPYIFFRSLHQPIMFWHPVQSIVFISLSLVQVSFAAFASRLSRRGISIYFHVMMALTIIFPAFSLTPNQLVVAGVVSCFFRLLFCSFYLHMPSVVCWNLIYLCVLLIVLAQFASQDITLWITCRVFVVTQIWICALIVLFSYASGRTVHQAIRQQLELNCLENSNKATKCLLSMVCDLTINLDEELVITDDTAALAAMLMHHNSNSLEGKKLEELFATAEDVERFKAHLLMRQGGVEQDQSLVTAFHCGLKDASGSIIQVEAFLTMYRAMSAEVRYLVGIREFADHVTSVSPTFTPREGHPAVTKLHHLNEGKGTPPQSLREGLLHIGNMAEAQSKRSHSSSTSSAGSGGSRKVSKHLMPNLRPTSTKVADWIMVNSLLQVNWMVSPFACCNFHATIAQYRSHLKAWLHRKCVHDFGKAIAFGQCQGCGIVYVEDDFEDKAWECPVCEV